MYGFAVRRAALVAALVLASGLAEAQDVLIREFLALGGELVDEDGDTPDWLEIHNPSGSTVDLDGWYLTDDPATPRQWRLPAVTLPPGERLVVFASGKDRADAGHELHTGFRLTASGEYLALIRPDGSTVEHEYTPAYPVQYEDISYGIPADGGPPGYFPEPTPGLPNDGEVIDGFVSDTKFSVNRGFFDTPFDVEITSATGDAEIRYTLDGTAPSATHGTVYEGPIRVERTTTLRALALRAGLEPTNVDTHTYIFLDDVIRQTHQATLEAGLPSRWGSTSPDYGMDSQVIGPGDIFGGVYAATIIDDLRSLPTVSIVLNVDDMFGSRGIYTNSTQRGDAWERAASAELIHPDGSTGFQVNCGIRIQGGYFRQHSATRKHSLRLLFKRPYGPTKLRYPWFGKRAVERFDTITLRAGANDGYSWDAARLTEQYTRDEFGRSLQIATGQAGSHGTFVHLYINGVYWGLYNPVERPDHSFCASYYGGDKDDWDSVHDLSATNGSTAAWNAMVQQTVRSRSSLDEYMKLQGLDPDGTRNPSYSHLLDVPNYVDYLIVNVWGGNWDWPWKNWWAARLRTDESTGFKFFCWDYENTIGNNRGRSPLTKNALSNDFSSAGQAHANLRSNPEYRLLFADRAQRLLFGDGPLTPDSLIARYQELADGVERAIVGESARWGDQHHHPPLGLPEWTNERDWVLETYLPQRTDIVIQQLVSAGLYPRIDAPMLSHPGGRIEPGLRLLATASAGAVYYTTDGTDPRRPGGALSPTAIVAGGGDAAELVGEDTAIRYLVPTDASLGLAWAAPDFDDGDWAEGSQGIGYDRGSGYEELIASDAEAEMYDRNATAYVRIPFQLGPELFEDGVPQVASVNLLVRYDDGFVAYLNGHPVAGRNEPTTLEWDSRATRSNADSSAVEFERISLPEAVEHLVEGDNLLAIHALNSSDSSSDFLFSAKLTVTGFSEAIEIDRSTRLRLRALDGSTWSAIVDASYIVDIPIRITELMYHPAPPPEGSGLEESDLEFVELRNVGTEAVDLTGLRLEEGIYFDLSTVDPPTLSPGEVLVIAKDPAAFATRYDTTGLRLAGGYRGKLDNSGDFIVLRGPFDEAILEFEYDDAWHALTDGEGPSLAIADSTSDPETWGEATSWRPSLGDLGSPGVDEFGPADPGGLQVPGDIDQDGNLNITDAVGLLGHLFMGLRPNLPCGDGSLSHPSSRRLLDATGDGDVDISDPIHLLQFLFLGGPPHHGGVRCVPIEGCPDTCTR